MRKNFKKAVALAMAGGFLIAGLATGGIAYASEPDGAAGIIAASENAFRHCFNLTEDGQTAACLNGIEGTCTNENCTAENRAAGTCTNESCVSDGTEGTCTNGNCVSEGTAGKSTNGDVKSQSGTGRGCQNRKGTGCITN